MASSTIEIQQLWAVTGAHIKNQVVLQSSDIEWVNTPSKINGSMERTLLYRMAKGKSVVQRLVLGKMMYKGGITLAHTTIFETLMELRDKARTEAFDQLFEAERQARHVELTAQLEGRIDISFDAEVVENDKPTQTNIKKLPHKFVKFMAPSMYGAPGVPITAMIEPKYRESKYIKSNLKTLHIELNHDVLAYLHYVAFRQAEDGVHRVHARGDAIGNWVSRISSGKYKGKYVFRKAGEKQRTFNARDDDQAAEIGLQFARQTPNSESGDDRRSSKRSRESGDDKSDQSEEAISDIDQ